MSLNKVMLIGNLGKDPEVRYLDNQKVVAQFTLATSETFTDRSGEKRTETEWHTIEMWDNLARIAEKYLKKGNQVYIEGKIKTENWKDKEGNERTGKKIRAIQMTLLGGNRSGESNNTRQSQPETSNNTGNDSLNENDDLPF
jgi:single-strand DNA-binding protein